MTEPWLLVCVLVPFSIFGAEACDVEIAEHCCRKGPLPRYEFGNNDGFQLICFSKKLVGNETLDNAAFAIDFRGGEILTVSCMTATPKVPSLLSYLNVSSVSNFIYRSCEVPEGNLSFARILEGNEQPVVIMTLTDPQKMPNRTLEQGIFGGIEADLRSLHILQIFDRRSLDLSDDFFDRFTSLRKLTLEIFANRIPSGLKALTTIKVLEIARMQISEISPDAFSGLHSLDKLNIHDIPIARFGNEPFSDLKNLTSLEMSRLNAVEIPANVFMGLTRMKSLEIERFSALATIHPAAFNGTPNLSLLSLEFSPLLEALPAGLFRELGRLLKLRIHHCGLKFLPIGLWPRGKTSTNELEAIDIAHGSIETLTDFLFVGNEKLQRLNLESNHLTKLGKSLRQVSTLQELTLYKNRLTSILKDDFKDLKKLTYLNLEDNGITSIEQGSFENLVRLESLMLSNNKLHHFLSLITAENRALRRLMLFNNSITDFPNIPFGNLSEFTTLRLDGNLLERFDVPLFLSERTRIYLRRNRIGLVAIPELPELANSSRVLHVFYVDDNPFLCTGENFVFLKYIQELMRPDVAEFQNLTNCFCRGTRTPLTAVNTAELFTEVEGCAEVCQCYNFPSNISTHVRCRNQNLTTFPILPSGVTELDLEGNLLTTFPDNISEYRSLRVVNLRRNRLNNIDSMFSSPPRSLRSLHVEFNELNRLEVDPNAALGFNVALSDNPWICDCGAENFKTFIDKNELRIRDYPDVKCENSLDVNGSEEFSLSRIPLDILCPTMWIYDVFDPSVLLPSIVVLVIAVLLGMFLFFRSRGKHPRSCPDDLDESKEFDAFLSYAAEDRKIAMELLHKLESGAESANTSDVPFKLCYHERDFAAGEWITTNISKAVRNSRRTIIVLSKEFLQSSWFRIEFGAAYNQTLQDPNFSLIIIISGNISEMKNSYKNLDAVLSSKTYLVWGELYLWKKLYKAMPEKGSTIKGPGNS